MPEAEVPDTQELTPEEKKAKAIALFQEGQALAKDGNYAEAIAKFQEAYDAFADPNLLFMIGEVHQRDGTARSDFEVLKKAVEAYGRYVEAVPEGPGADKARERIGQLTTAIDEEAARLQRIADEEKQAKLDAEREENERKAKEAQALLDRKNMQIVLDGTFLAGADLNASGILRFGGGALFSWEHFAFEAHMGVDGLLRVNADEGVSGRSVTLLDLGVRYGLNYRYVGPFVTAGAGFGLFTGKPRNRNLTDEPEICAGFDQAMAGSCSFTIDKNITGRLGFGYGFNSGEKHTMALRIDAQMWALSVDTKQDIGSPPARQVEKPQLAFALMVGLEFMRWL